jgi:hypothetical protein
MSIWWGKGTKGNFGRFWCGIVMVDPHRSVRAVKGMNCLRRLKRWGRGFESYSRHGCLCAFILFVLSCV